MSNQQTKQAEPRLRFPEFLESGAWEEKKLGEISARITEKVGEKTLTTVSISAGVGFVSQAEKFSRDISGKQYKNYIHLKKGEFSYNKGNSKKFPQGCIYALKEYEEAAVPNAFFSFRFHEISVPGFYQGYFDNNVHGKQLLRFITSGARMDGLLNINASDFFSIVFPTPKEKAEQQKIADCLSSLDDLITAHGRKLDELKQHKKGLMQKLFPAEGKTLPEWRFPEFVESGAWEEKKLGEFCDVLSGCGFPIKFQGQIAGKYPFCKVSDISLAVLENGGKLSKATNYINADAVQSLKATIIPKGATVFAKIGEGLRLNRRVITTTECIIDNNTTALKAKNMKAASDHFVFLLSTLIDLGMYCSGAIPSVNKTTLEAIVVFIPSLPEQQKIADCLSSLDDLITAQTKKLEALKLHKKGLLQGLFPSMEEVSE